MRVLVAGAGGAIGRRLVPQLIEHGHDVVATTSTPTKLAGLRELGAEAMVMDGLNAASVGEVVARAEPEAVPRARRWTTTNAVGLRRWRTQRWR